MPKPRSYRRLTKTARDLIVRMWASGITQAEIARQTHWSEGSVYNVIRKAREENSIPQEIDEQTRYVFMRQTAGASVKQIADELGVGHETVRRIVTGIGRTSNLPAKVDGARLNDSEAAADAWLERHPMARRRVGDLYPEWAQTKWRRGELTPTECRALSRDVVAIKALWSVRTFAARHFPELLAHQTRWLLWIVLALYRLILSGPRHGKSHVVSLVIPCWLLAGGGERRKYYLDPDAALRDHQVMLVSASEDQARKNFLAIEGRLTTSGSSLIEDYGRFKETGLPWSQSKGSCIIAGRQRASMSGDFSLFVVGCKSKVFGRGARWIILDDIADPDNCRSPRQVEEIFTWLQANVLSRLDDTVDEPGAVWAVGHRLALPTDVYAKVIAMTDLTVEVPDQATGETTRLFDVTIQPCILDYSRKQVLAPTRMSWKQLMLAKSRQPDTFDAMYQQIPSSSNARFVNPLWVWGSVDAEFPGCLDLERPCGESTELAVPVARVLSIDPAPSGPAAAILMDIPAVVHYSPILIDIDQGPMPSHYLTNLIHRWWDLYHFEWLVLERNFSQYFLGETAFTDWIDQHGVKLIEHRTEGTNKNDLSYGEGSIAFDIEAGRVRIPWGDELARAKFSGLMHELFEEVSVRDRRMALWFPKWNLPGIVSAALDDARRDVGRRTAPPMPPPLRMMRPTNDAEALQLAERRAAARPTESMRRLEQAGLPW